MLNTNDLETIRKKDFIVHCKEVDIWQNCDNGILLKGHGIIKKNLVGTLYLEFICTSIDHSGKTDKSSGFYDIYPNNQLNNQEKIFGKFVGIDDTVYLSDGFCVSINFFNPGSQLINILLPDIKVTRQSNDGNVGNVGNSLYLEFYEDVAIPKNKRNETKSSDGSFSSSWNETELKFNEVTINITSEDEYTKVRAVGDFDYAILYDAIKFFLGISSGKLVQPYIVFYGGNDEDFYILKSINNSWCRKTFYQAIPNTIVSKNIDNLLYLFKNISLLRKDNGSDFDGLNSQWGRVWHGFNSVSEISTLVLSVGVEGILNDFFINKLKNGYVDHKKQKDVEDTISLIKNLNIPKENIAKLTQSISYWTDIRSAKALHILCECGIINKNEKVSWSKLRNSAAHPRSSKSIWDEGKITKDLVHLTNCVNLFHKLILNVLMYTGDVCIYSYPPRDKTEHVVFYDVLSIN